MKNGNAKAGHVNITKYVKIGDPDGNAWRFCPVVRTSNGRIRPDYVVVDGKSELHKEGSYYIDWNLNGKRRRESVGKNASDAMAAAERKEQVLANQALGIEVVEQEKTGDFLLSEACHAFLQEARQKRPKTHAQYKTALEYFQESCSERGLQQIRRGDLITFMNFLNDKGLARRTIWTKVQVVVSMLKTNGVSRILKQRDWPRFTETEPEVFTAEEVETFFAKCNAWKRAVFEFLWMTGFREAEAQYVTWPDIDFVNRVVRVRAKPKLGFIPKDWEEREVPMPDRLFHTLQAHKATVPQKCLLVFATKNGRAVHNLLRQCKSIAWRAGLNCGLCDSAQGHCGEGPYCENWFLHKWRATFATMHLRAGNDLRTVQFWMGHKDLQSTSRYLKPARGNEALKMANTTFGSAKIPTATDRDKLCSRPVPVHPLAKPIGYGLRIESN